MKQPTAKDWLALIPEAAPSGEPSQVVEESPEAPIHVLAPLTSHRERDEDYPTLIRLSDVVRVIDCKDGLQWFLQRRYGDQWRGVAFCRRRDTLIREAKRLLGHVSEALLGLPEHHDGPIDEPPRCGVCGRLSGKPSRELPRHFFCFADRGAA